MVNKLSFLSLRPAQSLWGELREFLLNVGLILSYNNGGKPPLFSQISIKLWFKA